MQARSPFPKLLLLAAAGMSLSAAAQAPPPDPWPRQVALSNAAVTIYQPQVESWDDNQIQVRAAVSIKPAGAAGPSFGAVFASARTEVDRVARTVVFNDLSITKSNFPTLPDQGAAYAAELKAKMGAATRTISLDRVEASLKAAGVKAPSFPVKNEPPRIIVSSTPAILVPIDGAPVIKPLPDEPRFKRIINTRALMLQGGLGDSWYLHVYDGWLSASALEGPWTKANRTPIGMDDVARKLAASGIVDMLSGSPNANPRPSLANGVPTIYVSQVPTELVVFKGNPNFVPVAGTLLWASNSSADVFIDTTTNDYFVLLSGRWFRAAGTNGPWSFVPANALPPDFARIPTHTPAAVVLAAVAGTPQAQEAVIANSIPQTATVPLAGGPSFVPSFDGPPQFQPIEQTPLSVTTNASVPIIQVDPGNYFAVSSGVWFTAPAVTGPWRVATSVPNVIYTIPPSSVAHFVTYVRIYGATPEVVYVGYTPGYMGTVVGPYGTVVYGTGYTYAPWVGSVWYPPPYTYGVAAVPVYNPAVGFTYGFAVGLATAAWVTPYYGAAYHPYACCGSATASVYGQYGNTAYSGTKTAYAGGGVAGVSGSGSYYNKATGTSGNYSTDKSYNANTGVAKQTGAVSGTGAAGGTGTAAAGRSYNTETGQRSYASTGSATGAGGSSIEHSGATTAGPQGYDHTGSTTTTNAKTGETGPGAAAALLQKARASAAFRARGVAVAAFAAGADERGGSISMDVEPPAARLDAGLNSGAMRVQVFSTIDGGIMKSFKTSLVLAAAVLVAGCVSQQKYDSEVKTADSYAALNQKLSSQLSADQAQITQLQNQLKVTMVDEVLFPEGGWQLSAKGEAALAKIAPTLSNLPGQQIVVEGFTDNVPIGPALRARFPSNLELSSARAGDVVRFLVSKGVPANTISAQGFGETRPVASNDTAEGRAKNRRVEIVISSASRP